MMKRGKKVTGFSNQEEDMNQTTAHVPFLTETELTNRGAIYQKAPTPWADFAVVDGRIVTGQNPASGASVGKKVLEIIGKK
jgi:putative intracellular protease/amidase